MTSGLTSGNEGIPFHALVADDQADVLEALRVLLKGAGCQMVGVTSPMGVVEALLERDFDVLLMDLNYARDTTSGREGLDLVARVRSIDPTLPIVAMTAWSSVDLAVETMRNGVRDFVRKPWENKMLLTTLRQHVKEGRALRRELRRAGDVRRAASGSGDQRRETQMAEARMTQERLLPSEMPALPGYQFAGAWEPALGVGGDLFDIFATDGESIALCVADVAGKGMPAALLMSNLQAAVEAVGGEGAPPAEVCGKVNRILCRHLSAARFVTCFYALLDPDHRILAYTNAGHNAPVLAREDGTCSRLRTGGGVLGTFPHWDFVEGRIELAEGDRLVIFTDGLTEATNAAGEEFGETRLIELIEAHRSGGAESIKHAIISAVEGFADGGLQDDATLVVMGVDRRP